MEPNKESREFLDMIRGAPPLHTTPPHVVREQSADQASLVGPGREVAAVEHLEVPAADGTLLGARLYRCSSGAQAPLILYFHGGGWVLGDLDTADHACRELCMEAECHVLSVDYRLAPEHPFPVPADDAYAAARFAESSRERLGGDGRLVVAGDSAGGNLAAVTALRARDEGGPHIDHQLLVYPITDRDFDTDSYRRVTEGLLTPDTMKYFWGHYLADEADAEHPYASPLRATDHSGLPPATVVVAGYDPLHDEGVAYADRLASCGVDVALLRYEGAIHGFWNLPSFLSEGRAAIGAAARRLRQALLR